MLEESWKHWSFIKVYLLKNYIKLEDEKKIDVCYNRLFKMLIDKGMKKKDFRITVGIGENTLAKLSNNENVSLDVIIRICRTMNCTVDEILEILPMEQGAEKR